jgi:hypothetical protein
LAGYCPLNDTHRSDTYDEMTRVFEKSFGESYEFSSEEVSLRHKRHSSKHRHGWIRMLAASGIGPRNTNGPWMPVLALVKVILGERLLRSASRPKALAA